MLPNRCQSAICTVVLIIQFIGNRGAQVGAQITQPKVDADVERGVIGYDTRSIEADLPADLQNLTLDLLGYGNASSVRFICINS